MSAYELFEYAVLAALLAGCVWFVVKRVRHMMNKGSKCAGCKVTCAQRR